VLMSAIQASDVPTLNQNTTGTAANVTGTVALGNGGTGQITQQAAINALAGAVTSGQYLRGNGTNVLMSAIQASDVPTLNQNTTGSAATWTTSRTLTIGSTGKLVNGGANVSWSLSEIGAAATNQTFFIGTTQVAINRGSGALTLNGVSIDGSAGSASTATTATQANQWTTNRTLTIGNTGKSVNGSSNVSWSLSEIGVGTLGQQAATSVSISGGSIGGSTSISTSGSITSTSGTAITGSGFSSTSGSYNFSSLQSIGSNGGSQVDIRVWTGGTFTALRALRSATGTPEILLGGSGNAGLTDNTAVSPNVCGVGYKGVNGININNGAGGDIICTTTRVGKTGGGTFFDSSDERLKTNIRNYDVGLDTIMQIEPKRYDLLDRDRKVRFGVDRVQLQDHVGLVAQQVLETDLSDMVWEGVDGYYNIENTKLTFALVNAVKELNIRLSQQQQRIDDLESQLDNSQDRTDPA
jgi:hypothetical protein